MDQIINQYSAIWIAAGLVLAVALFLFRHKPRLRDFFALGIVIAGLVVAWVFMRPTQTPLMEDAKAVQEMIGQGKPVLLEFQSPY